jgi:hypothetical protein
VVDSLNVGTNDRPSTAVTAMSDPLTAHPVAPPPFAMFQSSAVRSAGSVASSQRRSSAELALRNVTDVRMAVSRHTKVHAMKRLATMPVLSSTSAPSQGSRKGTPNATGSIASPGIHPRIASEASLG